MTTFYRALLRLYPASFRADYGDELTATFEEQTRDRSRLGAMLAAIADVIPNALAVHRDMPLGGRWTVSAEIAFQTFRSWRDAQILRRAGRSSATSVADLLEHGNKTRTIDV
jgi:ACT domain-containing protein